MSKKIRRILFYSFLCLFVLAGGGIIFFSQGWRLKIESCQMSAVWKCQISIVRTGAIFIESRPKGVIIKIDGEIFEDKSGLIQSGTLITNLLPKDYKVEIEKDGYLSWEKNVRVGSGLVAELFKIVLIQEEMNRKSADITKSIDDFWINQEQKIIFKNKEGLYYFLNSPSAKESGVSNIKLRGDKFIQWSESGDRALVKDSKNQIYYLYDFNDPSKILNVSAILNNFQQTSVSEISFYPFESNKLMVKDKKGGLSLLDLNRLKLEGLVDVLAWTIKNSNLYYIGQNSKSSFLGGFNLVLKTSDNLIDLPENLGVVSEISSADSKIAFLTESGGLYLFNREAKTFEQIAHSAKKFAFSYDNKKIAFLDKNGKLNVYFLEDYRVNINKKTGEVISFSFYENEFAVKDIFWYRDSDHLLIEYSDKDKEQKVDFIEVDGRTPINKYTLIDDFSSFYYDLKSSRLYFIQKNNLYFSEI